MNPEVQRQLLRRVLPKVKLRDLDWKWLVVLFGLMFITLGDDFVLPIFGTLLDFLELPLDVAVAMILSRNTIKRAVQREAVTVQGKVVDEGSASAESTSLATQTATQFDNRLG